MTHHKDKIIRIHFDNRHIVWDRPEMERECKIAIYEILEENSFVPVHYKNSGPFIVYISLHKTRLDFIIHNQKEQPLTTISLEISVFRSLLADYLMICDSYHESIQYATPAHIETIDMGRRALHNEGAEIIQSHFSDLVHIDHDTARRLFTLLYTLLL